MERLINRKGGMQARIGFKFVEELKEIKIERLKNGKSDDMISTEQITNLITRHLSWKTIKKDLIEAPQEEIDKHGK